MAYTTIDDPTIFFNTILYSGTGSDQSVTGTGFTADWIWLKERNGTDYHFVNDSVRGKGTNNHYLNIFPNATTAELDQTTGVNAINSNGFDITYRGELNESGKNYVAWNWKAGGSASSNSDGDVTASVSANTTAGFSIVKFTSSSSSGAMTVGHGLGATPQVVIVKDIGATGNWQVYFEGIGTANQQYLKLNANAAVVNYSGLWGAGMTSSLIGIGVGVAVDASESDIAYCFAEKKGYSKFGTYTGNGNADGTFVYTGFKPAWVLFKKSSATAKWYLVDNKRDPFNDSSSHLLYPDSNHGDETLYGQADFLSNGVKIRSTDGGFNTSGATYIYMAFAESPFVTSTGIPTTAR